MDIIIFCQFSNNNNTKKDSFLKLDVLMKIEYPILIHKMSTCSVIALQHQIKHIKM